MAKISAIETNLRRQKLVARYAEKRAELKVLISDQNQPADVRFAATLALAKLPRNSSKTRVRNRCLVTGRPRAYYRKFKMSRIALRDLASSGMIPGVTKSSW
jgi:small subunit ribosomal protein S14